jgi:choline dehydrogenase
MKRKLIFDYIIVGTGPAGAAIAKTLSDDKKTSVLVLEAGGNNDKDKPISDSAMALELEEQYFPQYFWQGEGVPQAELNDRSFEWTTGRLSGGGSSINGEQYVRPTGKVFNEWERLLGPLWSPKRAVQRFRRLEKYSGKTNNAFARGYHGRIDIRQAPINPTSMAKKLVAAIERATGFPEILDYNNPKTTIGPFTRWQLYQNPNGRRESSSTAFLSSDVLAPNGRGINGRKLRLYSDSTALRVIFSTKRARGVEFLKNGKRTIAHARKKVIISAGINSAQLLMLSGIGSSKILKKAGIPCIVNNPNVGKSLRNHTLNFAVFQTNPNDKPLPSNDPNALYTGGAFLPDPLKMDRNRRAVQILGIGSEDGTLTLGLIYLRPKSRGSVKIQNKDPLKIVLADEGFLDNPSDMEAVKNIYKIYVTNIAAELSSIDPAYCLISPTPEMIDDDSELEQFIKESFEHNHHQQCSLRMAPLKNGGVVDRRGNVHGVKDLVVADASIIPFTVDGNTSAAAFLIGYTIAKQIIFIDKKLQRKKIRMKFEYAEE